MEFSPRDKIASAKRLQSHASHSSSSSFSSSSSSSRSNSFSSIPPDISPFSPSPCSFPLSRVPFSWEHQPGIPKKSDHHSSKMSSSSAMILPLPPSAPSTCLRRFSLESAFRKKSNQGSLERDPFALALLECSKHVDQDNQVDKYWKMSRVLTDRFGFIDRYTSCKKSCAVTESLVLLPRSIRKS